MQPVSDFVCQRTWDEPYFIDNDMTQPRPVVVDYTELEEEIVSDIVLLTVDKHMQTLVCPFS